MAAALLSGKPHPLIHYQAARPAAWRETVNRAPAYWQPWRDTPIDSVIVLPLVNAT